MGERPNRRRGVALEDAILDATWELLNEHGYDKMTLAGVAERAGTSRPVLHRRWPSRLKLAAAALARSYQNDPTEIPDLGNTAEELKLLLRRMSDRWRPELVQVALEMTKDLRNADSDLRGLGKMITDGRNMHDILGRAEARGELDRSRLSPRIITLPTDLVRHELIMTMRPLPTAVIGEIVDEIFLPLVRSKPQPSS